MARDFSLIRSWLFVPGDSERKLAKSWDCGADALIVDLEDAVAAENKLGARATARGAIAAADRKGATVTIRVNALDTGLTFDDIEQTIACRPDGYMLPKVMAPDDIRSVSRHIGALEAKHGFPAGSVRLIPIVTEHPRAVLLIDALCSADPRSAAILWGSEDLSANIGSRRVKNPDGTMLEVYRVVRALALLGATAHGLASIDTPVVELDTLDVLAREAGEAAAMGYTGKAAIHPSQVAPINAAFLPPAAEVEYARSVLAAAATAGSGAFRFQGKMIDMPHVRGARRVVAMADAYAGGSGR